MNLKKYFIEPIQLIFSQPALIAPAFIPFLVNSVFLFAQINLSKSEFILFVLFLFAAEFLAHSVLARAVFNLLTQKEFILSEAFKATFRKLSSILFAVVLIGASAVVGFMLFLIPGLAVLLFSIFVAQEIVINSKSAVEAVKGSFEIVKLHFLSVLFYFVVIFFLIFLISIFLNFLLPPIFTPFIALITTPYYAVSVTLLYFDLTEEVRDA